MSVAKISPGIAVNAANKAMCNAVGYANKKLQGFPCSCTAYGEKSFLNVYKNPMDIFAKRASEDEALLKAFGKRII